MENPNPIIYDQLSIYEDSFPKTDLSDSTQDEFTPLEIYDMLRNINDPEHPLTLEQLNVVTPSHITITSHLHRPQPTLSVLFTPTIPHCSMATLIGLCIRVKLERCLPQNRFLVKVKVRPGSHQAEADINKQLTDKERVAAAIENDQLIRVVNQCLSGIPRVGIAL